METYTYFDGCDKEHVLDANDDEEARLKLQTLVITLEDHADGTSWPGSELSTLRDRHGFEIRDPLEVQRSMLSEKQRAALHDRDDRSPLTEVSDRETLAGVAARHQPAIAAFPAREALEVRRIARDHATSWNHRERAIVDATKARLERQGLPRRDRAGRRQLDVQITRHEARAARAQRELDNLSAREREIRTSGRHPEQWVQQHGRQANQWAHAQRALDRADARDIELAASAAIANPPPAVKRTLGARGGDEAARDRYDELVGDLERRRLRRELTERDMRTAPQSAGRSYDERQELADRIRDSRSERGLTPDPPDVELAVDGPDLGLDL